MSTDKRYEYLKTSDKLTEEERERVKELEAASSLLERHYNELEAIYRVKIPLSHFNYFAPYFLGTKKHESEEELQRMWSACIDGNLQSEVAVYNDKNEDEVLFVVPPTMDTEYLEINPQKLKGIDYGVSDKAVSSEMNFRTEAQQMSNRNMHLRSDSQILKTPQERRHRQNVQRWLKIYEFYKIDIKDTIMYKAYYADKPNVPAPREVTNLEEFGTFESDL